MELGLIRAFWGRLVARLLPKGCLLGVRIFGMLYIIFSRFAAEFRTIARRRFGDFVNVGDIFSVSLG